VSDSESKSQVQFENPPVVEVACGVVFNELNDLLVPHFGLLWEEFKEEYPLCQEKPDLAVKIENLPGYPNFPPEVEFFDTPPLPRIWFLRDKEDRVIQVQRNRFLHNWRKVNASDEYPRFDTVIQIFERHLSTFKNFITKRGLGEIQPLQYEIIYVNIISPAMSNQKLTEIGRVFPDISWRNKQNRFLKEPESINWNATFLLPDDQGRVYVNTKTLSNADNQKFLMEITVRGIHPNQSSLEGLSDWFRLAHDWVVQSFTDLTSTEMQNIVWRKKDEN